MTKKQLNALLLIIKGVNTLRSSYTESRFTETDRVDGHGITNRLEIDCPFCEQAWKLALLIADNSTVHCTITDTKIEFE